MTETHAPGVDPAGVRRFTWIGDDHPPGWEIAGSIDVADPADVTRALDKGFRIGSVYDGGSGLYSEPCQADLYRRKRLTTPGGSDETL